MTVSLRHKLELSQQSAYSVQGTVTTALKKYNANRESNILVSRPLYASFYYAPDKNHYVLGKPL